MKKTNILFLSVVLFSMLALFQAINAASTSLEYIIDVENYPYVNFVINKNTGAFFDFDLSYLSSADKKINSVVLNIYLEEGRNIASTSEFVVYPINVKNKLVGDEGLIIQTTTTPSSFVNLILPLNRLGSFLEDTLGFVIHPLGEGEFVFHGNSGGIEKAMFLEVQYTEEKTIESMVSRYLPIEDNDRTVLNKILANTFAGILACKKQWYDKWYFAFILIPFIGYIVGRIAELVFRKLLKYSRPRRVSREVRKSLKQPPMGGVHN